MIWYFLAGFIAGAVGVLKLSKWLVETGRITVIEDAEDECPGEHPDDVDRTV